MPEIRTEADLNMFNQFMISLGRSAAGLEMNQPAMQHSSSSFGSSLSNSSVTGSPLSDQSPIEDLFNPEELASLGLGLPLLPSGPQLPPAAQNTVNFGSVYPNIDNRVRSHSDMGEFKRTIAGLPPRNHSVSGMSSYPDMGMSGMDQFNFDFLAQSKPNVGGSMQPRDFSKKTYRHVAPLGAAVSSRMRESRLRTAIEDDSAPPSEDEASTPRGSPAPRLAPLPSRPRISVQQLLTSDDLPDGDDLKLPAILDAEHAPAPEDLHLPSLRDLARPPSKRQVEDDIVRGVKRLELEDGERARPPTAKPVASRRVDPERMQHAAMIKAWLIHVNLEFRKRRLLEDREEEDELDDDE